jgi:hypothetical protein
MTFFFIHTILSFGTVLLEGRVAIYFEEKNVLVENENYFISFEQEVNFSLDMDEYFVLYKKIVGKKVYKKIERKIVEISTIKIQMEEKQDTIIVTTAENKKFEYSLL